MSYASAIEKEILTGGEWRILPEGAESCDKHKANLVLRGFGKFQSGEEYATGVISDDSRLLFPNGSEVRTSKIVDKYEVGGVKYIETRNTVYRLV